MPWQAKLQLDYTLQAGRTVARFQHEGPLRILQSLYPEGDAVCHNVLVHPPGGLVGGDTLTVDVTVAPGAHGLITTPGASRFYRSLGEPALQHNRLRLSEGARLEWLPLETIAYSGCLAESRTELQLAPGAELIGWDICALGLPHADQPFVQGQLRLHTELPGHWLERGLLDATDRRLMDSPLGLAGQRCCAMLYLTCGSDLPRARRDAALDLARTAIQDHALQKSAGATAPNPRVVVVRVLAPVVEPALQLLRAVRNAWRGGLWQQDATQPRIWAM